MKTNAISGLLLGLGLLAGCHPRARNEESQLLKKVLFDYFDGIRDKDHEKMKDATTDDFLVYEEGKAWTNDSVFREMERVSPFRVNFEFDHFKVFVDNESGHMSYFEQAHFVFRDTLKRNLNFLGSASFRKTADGWKMNFMHATPRYQKRKPKIINQLQP